MKSFAIRTFLVAAAVATLAACGSSSGNSGTSAAGGGSGAAASSSSTSAPAELKTASSPLGQIVVDAQGRTVYFFDKDTANSGKSSCSGQCLQKWPAVTAASDKPSVNGVTGQVGTITRDDGTKQMTLNGMPLYLYVSDGKAGDTTGQGVQGVWWVVSPSGSKITGSASMSAIPGY